MAATIDGHIVVVMGSFTSTGRSSRGGAGRKDTGRRSGARFNVVIAKGKPDSGHSRQAQDALSMP